MRISLAGMDRPIDVAKSGASVLEVENTTLYGRICRSLISGMGREAPEPYSLWDENGNEVRASNAFLPVSSPFDLPWDERTLQAGWYERMSLIFLEDDDVRAEVESLNARMNSRIAELGFQMKSEYSFAVEWDVVRQIKALGFGVQRSASESLLDNLIRFISWTVDAGCTKTILFVNLKTFLAKKDLTELYEQAFFLGSALLLLENKRDASCYEHEVKTRIDQHFIEC
ncbi:type II-A CRISPR-associated protein Csn2 [Raoultibacter phocaeensis]|uniref:type II-A CRISPR-associated protein Csn2 n=1 Tax=Raoultibacter phocaeensis TaxID=2479841 RepID=UPI00111A1838|nr:type II-A CRISPR-associated protein Csn2 [Raoultibacter phocaeensis]